MDDISTFLVNNGAHSDADDIRDALNSFNRVLSKKYQCRIFFRSRENLHAEAPTLLVELDLLWERSLATDPTLTSRRAPVPHFIMAGDIVIPYSTDSGEHSNRDSVGNIVTSYAGLPSTHARPLGYFVVINGVKCEEQELMLHLVREIAFEIVTLHHRKSLVQSHEVQYQLHGNLQSSNLLFFRPTPNHLARRRSDMIFKESGKGNVSILILPEKLPLIIAAPSRQLILRAALIAHELLGGASFIQWHTLNSEDVLVSTEWVRLENHSLFCDDLSLLDRDVLSRIGALTKEYRSPHHPLWIGGLTTTAAQPDLFKKCSELFPKIFQVSSNDISSNELKEDLENFLLLR